jgi:hypothetical protein
MTYANTKATTNELAITFDNFNFFIFTYSNSLFISASLSIRLQ